MTNFKSAITFLKTHSLEITTEFYQGKLGLPLALDQTTCRIFKICDGAYIGFCKTDEALQNDQLIFTLEIDDVDSVYKLLESKGVDIEVPPRFNPDYDIYQMFLRDPNNYLIEIQRFEDTRWPSS